MMSVDAPRPMPSVVSTEATPMMMPNMVKMERILRAARLSAASGTYFSSFTSGLLRRGG